MKIGKTDPVTVSHRNSFDVRGTFGGRKNCEHRWKEDVERVRYVGARPTEIGYSGNETTFASRCIECGQITVSTYISRTIEPTTAC